MRAFFQFLSSKRVMETPLSDRNAGMSAANTVVENGGRVVLLDKSSFCGGNSTKATSGINGAGRWA